MILAGLAGIAAAIAIYFTSESDSADDLDYYESDYVSDVDIEEWDRRENTGYPDPVL